MATPEERQKILEMVAAGQLSAQEAADLLSATAPQEEEVPATPEKLATPETPAAPVAVEKGEGEEKLPASGPTWLRVRVDDLASGRSKVSVNIPLRLMRVGLQLGANFAPELRNVEWDTLSSALIEGGSGLLVEVEDQEDGEHVRVYVE